jgi:hypothetical protein
MLQRSIVPFIGLLLALWPLVALADANDDQIAQQNALKARGNALNNNLNDITRCMLAKQGAVVSGDIAASQPAGVAGCAAVVAGTAVTLPATVITPAVAPPVVVSKASTKCPVVGRALNQVEMNSIGDYLTAKTRAETNHLPPPVPSDDVVALMNC